MLSRWYFDCGTFAGINGFWKYYEFQGVSWTPSGDDCSKVEYHPWCLWTQLGKKTFLQSTELIFFQSSAMFSSVYWLPRNQILLSLRKTLTFKPLWTRTMIALRADVNIAEYLLNGKDTVTFQSKDVDSFIHCIRKTTQLRTSDCDLSITLYDCLKVQSNR